MTPFVHNWCRNRFSRPPSFRNLVLKAPVLFDILFSAQVDSAVESLREPGGQHSVPPVLSPFVLPLAFVSVE